VDEVSMVNYMQIFPKISSSILLYFKIVAARIVEVTITITIIEEMTDTTTTCEEEVVITIMVSISHFHLKYKERNNFSLLHL
jgi:hypothetical protein